MLGYPTPCMEIDITKRAYTQANICHLNDDSSEK